MYAKVYCVLGRDKKNYGLSFPLEIVKKEGERGQQTATSGELEQNHQEWKENICFENIAKNKS